MLEIVNNDIAELEKLQKQLEMGLDVDITLEEMASVEFINDIRKGSKEFEEYIEDNKDLDFLVGEYIEHFGKPSHVIIENELFWTPHAISMITQVIEGR